MFDEQGVVFCVGTGAYDENVHLGCPAIITPHSGTSEMGVSVLIIFSFQMEIWQVLIHLPDYVVILAQVHPHHSSLMICSGCQDHVYCHDQDKHPQ